MRPINPPAPSTNDKANYIYYQIFPVEMNSLFIDSADDQWNFTMQHARLFLQCPIELPPIDRTDSDLYPPQNRTQPSSPHEIIPKPKSPQISDPSSLQSIAEPPIQDNETQDSLAKTPNKPENWSTLTKKQKSHWARQEKKRLKEAHTPPRHQNRTLWN